MSDDSIVTYQNWNRNGLVRPQTNLPQMVRDLFVNLPFLLPIRIKKETNSGDGENKYGQISENNKNRWEKKTWEMKKGCCTAHY